MVDKHCHHQRRTKDDTVVQGSKASKDNRGDSKRTTEAHEPTATRRRIFNITATTKTGDKITAASGKDTQEHHNVDQILMDPIIYNNDEFHSSMRQS